MTSIKTLKRRGRWRSVDTMKSTEGFQSDLESQPVCFAEIKRRNLIYHVAPFRQSEGWMRNLRQIIRRIDLFNGKRVAAIVYGAEMVEPSCVTSVLDEYDFEYVFKPNSRRLRERQTFTELMQAVESTDPDEATFYAHSKGVASLGNPSGVMYWRNAMYHALLDDWDAVHTALQRFPIVGTHRRMKADHQAYPDGTESCWHFSGTFFWFRNATAFERADWNSPRRLPQTGWAVEAWPGRMFDMEQSWCLGFETIGNAYNPESYKDPIPDPEIDPPHQANLKVELGGGKRPKGGGFINLDAEPGPTVDVVCDFEHDSLPFEDDTVSFVYSAHCIEHIDYRHLLKEIVRICHIGARVEIVVPYWLSPSAMCQDHKHTIAEDQVENHWMQFLDYYWSGCRKRLFHHATERRASPWFDEARALFPNLSEDQVMRFIPGTCHEVLFVLTVIPNANP